MQGFVLLRRIIGVILLIAIGLIHLIIVRAGFHLQAYLGILFVIDVVAAFVGAVWIGLFGARLGWSLGLLASLGPLLGYIVSEQQLYQDCTCCRGTLRMVYSHLCLRRL